MEHLIEPIVNATLHALRDYGIWAVFVLMILESACIPAPSEVIMLFAGYLVWKHDATMFEVVTAGVAGNVIGSWIAWGAGRYGGRPFIERHGGKVRLNMHHLAIADRWFARHGDGTVLLTRMLPIVRTFISLPAGIARMPLGRFTAFTFVGCVPWVFMLAEIGTRLGPRWEQARTWLHGLDYLVIAGIGAALLVLWWRWRRGRLAVGQPGT